MSIHVITAQAEQQPLAATLPQTGFTVRGSDGDDLSMFRLVQAAAAEAPEMIVMLLPRAGLLGEAPATASLTALGLMRIAALDLAEKNIFCHAIAVDAPTDHALVAELIQALARDQRLPSGQVFACHDGRIDLLSQPRPIRVTSRAAGEWSFDEIDTVARDLWRAALTPMELRP